MEGGQGPNGVQEMNIFLKVIKTIPLTVSTSDTIDSIKAKVRAVEGVAANHQELFFQGNHLKENRTLVDYNVPKNSTINLYISNGMQLFVKIPSIGKTIQVEVKKLDTVGSVKAKIENKEGIPVNQQTLIYLGKRLEDTKSLLSLNIQNGSTLSMVLCPTDDMHISIAMVCGKTIDLEVRSLYTIQVVKIMIESLEGISTHRQELAFYGKQLENSLTLHDYKISTNSILQLEEMMQIFIRTWGGKSVLLTVKETDTIAEVLVKFGEAGCVLDSRYHYFSYCGSILENHKTLAYYHIKRESTIHEKIRAVVPVEIFVKIEGGETLSFNLTLNMTTAKDVKALIQKKTNVSHREFVLSYNGRWIHDKSILSEHNVQNGSELTFKKGPLQKEKK